MPPVSSTNSQQNCHRSKRLKVKKTSVIIRKNKFVDAGGKQAATNLANSLPSKKQQIERTFNNMNAEFARRSMELAEPEQQEEEVNVFTDILKIAPIIDLAEEEPNTSEKEAEDEAIEVPNLSESEVDKGLENPARITTKKLVTKKKARVQKERTSKNNRVIKTEDDNSVLIVESTRTSSILNVTSMSDIDLRERPDDIVKLKKRRMRCAVQQPVMSASTSKSDLDLRPNTGVANMEQQGSSTTSPVSTEFDSTNFISRVRLANRAPPIDMNQNYQLIGLRYFQAIQGKDLEQTEFQAIPLRVVSFNVLCQTSYASVRHLYEHLNRKGGWMYGHWDGRKPKLEDEFRMLSADVFCLQEVEDIHFQQFYEPFFASCGYKGIFTRRTGTPPDGCAIFWRPNKLELLHHQQVVYNLNTVGMSKDNVGQVAVFGICGHRTALCISNTHIHFNMNRGEIKLAQVAFLLSTMHQVETQFRSGQFASAVPSSSYSHFAGHILCGDFNMLPGSPLHRFIVEQRIDLRADRFCLAWPFWTKNNNNVTLRNERQFMPNYLNINSRPITMGPPLPLPVKKMRISGNCTFVNEANMELDLRCGELTHDFKLASVYEHWNTLGEDEISTYHKDEGQPDFIFYSVFDQNMTLKDPNVHPGPNTETSHTELVHESFIQLRMRLSLPTKAQMDKACGPLPNEQYGSDHLSLCANFDILCLPKQ